MPYTVEDGSGLESANAYISVAFADDYHTLRGNAGWGGSGSAKEAALIRATDYIDKRFGRRFRGLKKRTSQALYWPRIDAYDNENVQFPEIPNQLKKAAAEYALRALTITELAPDPAVPFATRDASGSGSTQTQGPAGALTGTSVTVGPITTEKSYSQGSSSSTQISKGSSIVDGLYLVAYPAADLMIEDLLKSSSSVDILRA